MNADRVVALVGAGLLFGCAHPCEATYHAATALDAACAAAGLETEDPELLLHCASQAIATKRALRSSASCGPIVKALRP